MDDSTQLISLSLAMFFGSFVAGAIPLTISLSERSLRLVSIIGAGLLVGTALAVIIPEGVHELYEKERHGAVEHSIKPHITREASMSSPSISELIATTKIHHEHHHGHQHEGIELHTLIGLSLSFGFIFMLLIDQVSGGHSHGPDLTNERRTNKSVATIGLVVHAAADGIALGAAATTSRSDVEMIVFFAIMLHKAPAAFGLTTFLLSESFDRKRIRKHLLVFSLAAPILALVTFYGLSKGSKEALSNLNGTGLAMLFSAGTFLYVATVHILPDLKHSYRPLNLEEGTLPNAEYEDHNFSKVDLALLISGVVLPIILSAFHHH